MIAGTARLFALKKLYQATRMPSVGRALVNALGSRDENLRTLAGMFLVQIGRPVERLLIEALRRRQHLPQVVTILGDIGATEFTDEIQTLQKDSDPRVVKAATDALRVMRHAREVPHTA